MKGFVFTSTCESLGPNPRREPALCILPACQYTTQTVLCGKQRALTHTHTHSGSFNPCQVMDVEDNAAPLASTVSSSLQRILAEPAVPLRTPREVDEASHQGPRESVAVGNVMWGVFRLSSKKAGDKRKRAGCEVWCPLHRKNQTTECKKWFAFGLHGEDEAATILRAKHWALQGRAYRKQWEHVFLADVWSSPPSSAELESQLVNVLPWVTLADTEQDNMSQAELDKHFAGSSSSTAASSASAADPALAQVSAEATPAAKPKPKAKGAASAGAKKAKAGGKAKAKAVKAVGKAAASAPSVVALARSDEAPPQRSSSSSSQSSSSSSSSTSSDSS